MKIVKRIFCIAALLGAALLFAVGVCVGSNARPAQSVAQSRATANDCSFAALTVGGRLGISPGVSDTLTGSAADRVVYFSNPNPSGTITVSALITGLAASCYVWASPAFSLTAQAQFTATVSAPAANIPYPVSSAHGPTVSLVLTSSANITGAALAPHQVITLTFIQDTAPPTWTLQVPAQSVGQTPIPIDWSVSDTGSGAAWLTLLYRQWPVTTWVTYTTTPIGNVPTGTLAFAPPTVWLTEPITYELTAQALDRVGNLRPVVAPGQNIRVSPARVYLPIVMREYYDFPNGDFEQGWLYWAHGQGPFLGHGSGLTQSIALFEGSHRALLGSPYYDDKNESIPVGYAFISRTIYVPASVPILVFSYRVHSFDTSFSITQTEYFDTFEVSINTPPDQVNRAQRDGAHGCSSAAVNPDNITRTPTTSGLVVCGGAPQGNTGEWDSNWRTVRINLAAFAGSDVTLYFSGWNREYQDPWFNDKGYYNTYSYVDDVMLIAGP